MISVVMLAYEEEEQLPETLEQVQRFADEIIVVDSHSEDRTPEVAKSYGAEVYQRDWQGYADAWNYGFKQATCDWILQLGADEVPSDRLVDEISDVVTDATYDGYKIHSLNYVFGKRLDHWTRYAPRLFKRGHGKMTDRAVHEHLDVDGEWGTIDAPIHHYTYENVGEYVEKLDRYTRLEAEEFEGPPSFKQTYILPVYVTLKLLFADRLLLDGRDGIFIAVLSGVYEYLSAYRARLRFDDRPYR